MRIPLAVLAATAAFTSMAFADDKAPASNDESSPCMLVFGEGVAKITVLRDPASGQVTFDLADPAVKVDSAPVVIVKTDAGTKEFVLTAVDGHAGEWAWMHDSVRADTIDGSMRVVVAGKTYTTSLANAWVGKCSKPHRVALAPRYGGRVLTLTDCGASVEVVRDPATGTLTVYSFDDMVVTEAPVVTFTETKSGPSTVTFTQMAGKPGVWVTKNETFKTTVTNARIKVLVRGKPCETNLVFGGTHGGEIVTVENGPSWEVVHDPKANEYTFYTVEETWNGKTYVVEQPTVVYGGRSYALRRVDNEPRAWRLAGLDTAGSDARDAQLNFTLLGKTLSTRLGLSGVGVGVR